MEEVIFIRKITGIGKSQDIVTIPKVYSNEDILKRGDLCEWRVRIIKSKED